MTRRLPLVALALSTVLAVLVGGALPANAEPVSASVRVDTPSVSVAPNGVSVDTPFVTNCAATRESFNGFTVTATVCYP